MKWHRVGSWGPSFVFSRPSGDTSLGISMDSDTRWWWIKPASTQTSINAWHHGHAFTSERGLLPRPSRCFVAMATNPRMHLQHGVLTSHNNKTLRHKSNKVSITLVGISCAIAGCPFPSVGDNAQTVKHFFRWCELPCASTATRTSTALHHLVAKGTGFKWRIWVYAPCPGDNVNTPRPVYGCIDHPM